jgi:hypothetical protein
MEFRLEAAAQWRMGRSAMAFTAVSGAVRTSLERLVPSAVTSDELAVSEQRYERELFHRHGVVVVRLRQPTGLPRLITMALEAWAKGRFG